MNVRRAVRILWVLAQNVSIVLMAGYMIATGDLREPETHDFVIALVSACFLVASILGFVWELQRKPAGRYMNIAVPVALLAIALVGTAIVMAIGDKVSLIFLVPISFALVLGSAGIYLMYEATAVGTPEEKPSGPSGQQQGS